jgi:6-phosphofructokinase 1
MHYQFLYEVTLKKEWAELLKELTKTNQISKELARRNSFLAVVGMVGSIDNDMCGFSMTIGCDTALHRICTAVDALTTTAQSHQRTFIIEVMGRNCGFLAVMTALACGADYVLVPENPPATDDWGADMADSLRRRRRYTNFSLIIVAEGATDKDRNPITCNDVKKVCSEVLGHDTRVTTLGHVQRGGCPSAYDRILSSRCGAEAALAVLNATPDTPSRIVGVRWNKMIQIDLAEAVAQTSEVCDGGRRRSLG